MKEVVLLASEYAQLVHDARRYAWLRDNMRTTWDDKTVTYFFMAPTSMSFQEAVDMARDTANDERLSGDHGSHK